MILRPSKYNIMRYKISVLNDLEAQLPIRRKQRFNTTRKISKDDNSITSQNLQSYHPSNTVTVEDLIDLP